MYVRTRYCEILVCANYFMRVCLSFPIGFGILLHIKLLLIDFFRFSFLLISFYAILSSFSVDVIVCVSVEFFVASVFIGHQYMTHLYSTATQME